MAVAVKRPRINEEAYYYFVSINYPFACTRNETDGKLAYYEKCLSKVKGSWAVARMFEPAFYYFKFSETAKPASQSTVTDFNFTTTDVNTDEILPLSQERHVTIQFQLYTESQVKQMFQYTFQEMAGLLSIPDQEPGQVLVQIERKIKEATSAVPALPKPYDFPESAMNVVVKQVVTEFCEQRQYRVYSEQSTITTIGNRQASRYYTSKPDLVVYSPKKLCGVVIVKKEETEEENHASAEEGTEEGEPELYLKGGITENKKTVEKDILGQLLAGMEKVAGDITFEYLSRPDSQRFHKIQITGLVIDYLKDECDAYELIIDFEQNISTLLRGNKKVNISDAINRLLSRLEK